MVTITLRFISKALCVDTAVTKWKIVNGNRIDGQVNTRRKKKKSGVAETTSRGPERGIRDELLVINREEKRRRVFFFSILKSPGANVSVSLKTKRIDLREIYLLETKSKTQKKKNCTIDLIAFDPLRVKNFA